MLEPATLQALPLEKFLFYLGFTLVVGLGATLQFYRKLIRARAIEDTPTSKIRSAAQGYVELEGRCEALEGQPLSAPLTRTPCLWYRYRIERYESGDKTGRWRTIDSGTSNAQFQLDDGTGTCVVDPAQAEVKPRHREVWHGNLRWPSPGMRRRSALIGGSYRYTEERLIPGEHAYVLGAFRTLRSDPAAEKTRRVAAWLANLKRDRPRLLEVYDTNRNGDIELREWEVARQNAIRQVERELAQEAAAPPISVIGRTGDSRRPFIIGCKPQHQLAQRYRWGSAAGLVLALIGNSLALWLLYARFVIS